MATTCNTEVGISPVLLQAITHQLSAPISGSASSDNNKVVLCGPEGNIILHQNESLAPTSTETNLGEQVQYVIQGDQASATASSSVSQNPIVFKTEADGKIQQWEVVEADNNGDPGSEMYRIEPVDEAINRFNKKYVFQVPSTTASISASQDVNMLNAVTAHKYDEGGGGDANEGQQIIIFAQEEEDNETSSSQDIAANAEVIYNDAGLEQASKRARYEGVDVLLINDSGEASYLVPNRSGSKTSQWSTYVRQFEDMGPCPICGDKVSGYHYGVYCCESCKGFFKRTVQNKKVFACHRAGECDVTVHSRKKCPACRFRKCVDAGMKVQAIREDRSRGGRSVYEGCSPRVTKKPRQNIQESLDSQHPDIDYEVVATSSSLGAGPSSIVVSDTPETSRQLPQPTTPTRGLNISSDSSSPVMNASILNNSRGSNSSRTERVKPIIPNLVTDIMNLESLLTEDDEDITNLDDNFYTSLLQLADHRLYKIVRWARSLPDFAIISTDDQILLLQNCWAELLCLDCCWRSIQSPTEIKLSYSKSISVSMARELGAEDIVNRMIALTEYLHHIQLDMREFACLKVLILMSPDMKGLKDIDRVRDYQEKVTDALMIYSSSHYPQHPNKFGELLLRLPELARTSLMGKEVLAQKDLPPEVSSFSLLMELLKTNSP